MGTQFITNDKGEKLSVIIPIAEYEDLLHQHHLNLELTDEYKTMIDGMLEQEDNKQAKYILFEKIRNRFQSK